MLTLSCPDRQGIVHAVSSYLLMTGCNIEDSRQFGDRDTGLFFMRVHFSAEPPVTLEKLRGGFAAAGDGCARRGGGGEGDTVPRFPLRWPWAHVLPHRRFPRFTAVSPSCVRVLSKGPVSDKALCGCDQKIAGKRPLRGVGSKGPTAGRKDARQWR